MRKRPVCNARNRAKRQRFAVDFMQCERETSKKPGFAECCTATDIQIIDITVHKDRTRKCHAVADRLLLAQLDDTLSNHKRGGKFTYLKDGASVGRLVPLLSPVF